MILIELLDIYKTLSENEGLFEADTAFFPFMQFYNENHTLIDYNFISKFGSWSLVAFENQNSTLLNYLQKSFKGYLATHADSYNRIYEALTMHYNPIENYNGQTEIQIEEIGKEVNANNIVGTKTSDNTITGTKSNELSITGSKISTMIETPEKIDKYSDTETTMVSSEGTAEFSNENKVIKEYDKRGEKNTDTYDNYKETTTESANDYHNRNIENYSADYENKNTKSFENRKTVTTENKHGNLGVVTSQSMVKDEILLRLTNNFYDLMFDDFVKQYCII